jgi:uroporphyrinogen decarboxylase
MSWMAHFPPLEPDYTHLARVFRREVPERVPVIELFADHGFIRAVLGYGAEEVAAGRDYADWQRYWLWRIAFQHIAGPDFINVGLDSLGYADRKVSLAPNTAALAEADRCWVNETEGTITNRAEFDAYPWPDTPFREEPLDFIAENIPPGMGIIATSSGILEWTMWLMGYQPLATALYDQPNLVRNVTDRIGQRFVEHYARAARHPAVCALWLGDDMGFKTATMISPDHLREYIFPWQRRLAGVAHAEGKPFLLHACGQLDEVMDDLIEDVGIDARHSFEDVIEPVTEFKRRYGRRVAVLGGVDIDVLSRKSVPEVRRYTREILEVCAPEGGYALGTGNSVTNYIPVRNYTAMLHELADFNASRH